MTIIYSNKLNSFFLIISTYQILIINNNIIFLRKKRLTVSKFSFFRNEDIHRSRNSFCAHRLAFSIGPNTKERISSYFHVLSAHFFGGSDPEQGRDEFHFESSTNSIKIHNTFKIISFTREITWKFLSPLYWATNIFMLIELLCLL